MGGIAFVVALGVLWAWPDAQSTATVDRVANAVDAGSGTASATTATALTANPMPGATSATADREPPLAPLLSTAIRFTDGTAASGLVFRHTSGRSPRFWEPEILGPGVTVFDADGDGRDDVLFVNGMRWPEEARPGERPARSRFFHNVGGRFVDETDASGLGLVAAGTTAVAFDADGDGDRDVVFGTVSGLRYFENQGHARFREQTKQRGLAVAGWTTVLAPLDVDGDGDLDLFVARYIQWTPEREAGLDCRFDGVHRDYCGPNLYPGTTPVLLLADGHGHFSDSGTAFPENATKALGALTVDLDDDGRMDLVVANDQVRTQVYLSGPSGYGGPGGTKNLLVERAAPLGFAGTEGGAAFAGMGIDGTFAAPGEPGFTLAIATFYGEPIAIYRRSGPDQPFLRRASALGLRGPSLPNVKFGLKWLDADLDGRDDLIVANGALDDEEKSAGVAFRQPLQVFAAAAERMADVSALALGPLASRRILGRALATLDFDGDGDLDAIVTENDGPAILLENRSTPRGHYINLRLAGAPPNADAIGATLSVVAGARQLRTWVHASGSYSAQSTLDRIFGLGSETGPAEVEVRWPSGRRQRYTNLAVDRRHLLREDVALPVEKRIAAAPIPDSPRGPLASALAANDLDKAIPLLERALVESPYELELYRELAIAAWSKGQQQRAADAAAAAAERAGESNVVVRSLIVVFLNRKQPELARAAAERAVKVLPAPSAELWSLLGSLRRAEPSTASAEQAFRSALKVNPRHAKAASNLALILNETDRAQEAIDLLRPLLPERAGDAMLRRALATAYYRMGQKDGARREYEAAAAADPNDPISRYNLGQLMIEFNEPEKAVNYLQRAVELAPNDFRSWGNLGFALKALGRIDEAKQAYRQVILIQPGDPIATQALSQLGG